jgi:hypothetical protein
MTVSPPPSRPAPTPAIAYRQAHLGKLMVVQRGEGSELAASDFFEFEAVGTHPTGLIVTGLFQNSRRAHMMASAVREASEAEIAWQRSSSQKAN